MQYSDTRYHMHVEFETEGCDIPSAELTRMEESLETVGKTVEEFPASDVRIKIIYHPRRDEYHVEGTLTLPAKTLRTGSWDRYFDSAFQRTVHKLAMRAEGYRDQANGQAVAEVKRKIRGELTARQADRTASPLKEAVESHDYTAFRHRLSPFDGWLNRRAGRWVQRNPAAEARLGRGFVLSDVVEATYLEAFEEYSRRPEHLALHEWLESLLDRALKKILKNRHQEVEIARLSQSI